MCLIALAVFGMVSLGDMNIDYMGEISTPQIYVISIYPGASSEDVEESVVDVMEDDFVTLQNYKSMTSQASNGVGITMISFADGVDPYEMLNEVRNRIRSLSERLPDGLLGEPTAMVGGADMLPVYSFTVRGGDDYERLSRYVEEELKPQLTRIPSVSTVTITGSAEPELKIVLDTSELSARGVNVLDVYQVLSANNISMPLGSSMFQGRVSDVRFDGNYSDIEEIRNLPVGSGSGNQIIRLGDVADVSIGYFRPDYHVRSHGDDVILVEVASRRSGNILDVINQIKDVCEKENIRSGGTLVFETVSDDSQVINSSLSTVIESGVMGVIIAILVIFLFLNDGKATFIIGMSIPLSIFFTFIGMKLFGLSVNMMSISGLVVALGAIVDASIVVLDQIYRYYQMRSEDGSYKYSLNASILTGAGIVDKSVIGSNLTTVVVFIPLALLSGLVGMILYPVTLTFMLAIFSSLFVAIIFIPFFSKLFLKNGNERKFAKESFIVKGVNKLEKGYRYLVGLTLNHAPFVITGAILLLFFSAYAMSQVGFAFIPSTDNNDFYINADFPYDYSLEETTEAMEKIEGIMIGNVPELKTYVTFSGRGSAILDVSNAKNKGSIHAILVPVKERDRDIHDIIRLLQEEITKAIPDVNLSVVNGGFDYLVGFISGGGGYGLTLVGSDQRELYEEALRLEDFLKNDKEVISTSINSNYDSNIAVLDLSYDYLTSLGLTGAEAGLTTSILFNGMDVGNFHNGDGNYYTIRLESDVGDKVLSDSLLNELKIKTRLPSLVSLSSLVDMRYENVLSQINHIDRSNTITISAQLTSESTTGLVSRVDKYLEENPLPPTVTTRVGGIDELLEDSLGPIVNASVIAVFLVYMVMVIVFERFKHPILIMLTIPFCAIGVSLSLALFRSTMNMVSILGIVSLVGMLVNNGIIMIDYINQLMEEGRREKLADMGISVEEGDSTFGLLPVSEEHDMLRKNIIDGVVSRLRPILMSSLTTILGVIPMAFATGEGAEVYAPLGQVIMGGLTTSTFITLFIIPSLYYLSERGRMKRKYKRKVTLEGYLNA